MRRRHVLALLGFLALVALHLDVWWPERTGLVLGWLPEEVAYRLAWIALAWLYLLFVCTRVWRSQER